jgi:molybdopterin biosynthesis enzyme
VAQSKDPRAALLERFAVTRGAAASRVRTDGEGWAGALSGQAAADLVVVLDPDGASETLSRAEATILGRLAARPGEGTVCALLDGKPILVLGPGLAEAAAAGLLVLGPWLERVTGGRRPLRRSGRLARKLASSVGLTEIALVRSLGLEFEPLAVADLTLTALARADAFVIVPPESEGWPAGAMVEAVEF